VWERERERGKGREGRRERGGEGREGEREREGKMKGGKERERCMLGTHVRSLQKASQIYNLQRDK
jgi:hypothetical protein